MKKAVVSPGAITKLSNDILDLAKCIGRVIDGNTSSTGASQGQAVVLINSTISGKSDGLYIAASAIPANTVINPSYLTSASTGGLNLLSEQIGNIQAGKTDSFSISSNSNYSGSVTFAKAFSHTPSVVASPIRSGVNPNEISHVMVNSITTTGFTFTIRNSYETALNCQICWFALDYQL